MQTYFSKFNLHADKLIADQVAEDGERNYYKLAKSDRYKLIAAHIIDMLVDALYLNDDTLVPQIPELQTFIDTGKCSKRTAMLLKTYDNKDMSERYESRPACEGEQDAIDWANDIAYSPMCG